jgi:hypothetical protein
MFFSYWLFLLSVCMAVVSRRPLLVVFYGCHHVTALQTAKIGFLSTLAKNSAIFAP